MTLSWIVDSVTIITYFSLYEGYLEISQIIGSWNLVLFCFFHFWPCTSRLSGEIIAWAQWIEFAQCHQSFTVVIGDFFFFAPYTLNKYSIRNDNSIIIFQAKTHQQVYTSQHYPVTEYHRKHIWIVKHIWMKLFFFFCLCRPNKSDKEGTSKPLLWFRKKYCFHMLQQAIFQSSRDSVLSR